MENAIITITPTIIDRLEPIKRYRNSFTEHDMAKASIDAYLSDWEDLCLWCTERGRSFLPANPHDVADYLEDRARNPWLGISGKSRGLQTKAPLKWNSLNRRLTSISKVHQYNEMEFNRKDPAIVRTLKGIKNKLSKEQPHRVKEKRKSPIIKADIANMVAALPDSLIGIRDRALLLVGFTCALRRSELARICIQHLQASENGFKLNIPWSKTGERNPIIPYGSNPQTCPVRALKSWIQAADLTDGPIFRSINRHGQIQNKALSDKAVALIIMRNPYVKDKTNIAKAEAREDPTKPIPNFGGHSLRAGFVTQAYLNGASEVDIMAQTGHRKSDTLKKYIRELDEWKNNAAIKLGL
ncbi:tyrosine-type recombinase/integrase [Candidatus Protochlamydia phocaeensis]|uniref:tyrosine-type recombinase/integrase n=1 Tax=Candidatus Protochlamydia phocaeensis TaxID=1414722 RepID=UPI0008380A7F|nr:tyrosine-type recombinase/integrase [Candidatus Protochlamydia phocaeensis]